MLNEMTDVKNPIVVKDNPFSSEYDFENPEYKSVTESN